MSELSSRSTRLTIVGGGRMGEALIGGLLRSGWGSAQELAVVEPQTSRREELGRLFPGVAVLDSAGPTAGAVLAVKPGDVQAACERLAGAPTARVLSIAAGVRLAQLESWLGPHVVVVRAMANTPALVGRGAAAVAAGATAGSDDLIWAEKILSAVGVV
ncbi:MAG: pyrroline-5-carboxylate reductase family protein, partial [Pseudonocardiaceae bacterium]